MPRFSFLQPVKTNRWRTGLLLLLVALAAWLISDLVLTRRPEPGPGPGNGYQIIKY